MVEISAALAADLDLLTQALDEPGADIAATVRQLAVDAGVAVPSLLGLSVVSNGPTESVRFTAMVDHAQPSDARTSLLLPLKFLPGTRSDPDLCVVLYAANPGAFVDLAADLAWLMECAVTDFGLDKHLGTSAGATISVAEKSVIDQAIGVLMGNGLLPGQASRELDDRAMKAGTDRHGAAAKILADLDEGSKDN